MKAMKGTSNTFVELDLNELEMVNGGDWRDDARFIADFMRGILSAPSGCGLGDVTGMNTAGPAMVCKSYPASNSGCH